MMKTTVKAEALNDPQKHGKPRTDQLQHAFKIIPLLWAVHLPQQL